MKWSRLIAVFILPAIAFFLGAQQLNASYAAPSTGQNDQPAPIEREEIGSLFSETGAPALVSYPQAVGLNVKSGLNSPAPLAPQAAPPCGGVFTATADTLVRQFAPDSNHNALGWLQISQDSTQHNLERTLLAFNPGSVPANATIQSAVVELYLYQDPAPLTYTIQVFSQQTGWDETTVTWDTQPLTGANFIAETFAITLTQPVSSVVRLDVTTWATLWATGEITNTGLTLAPAGSQAMQARFYTREVSGGAYPPRLVIRCTPAKTIVPLDSSPGDLRQDLGLQRLSLASLITPTLTLERGALRFANFKIPIPPTVGKTSLERAQWFIHTYSDTLRMDSMYDLQLIRRSLDDKHIFFRQLYHGTIPVYPTEIAVHLDGDQVTGVSGNIVPEITLSMEPQLSPGQAEAIALALAGRDVVLRGDTQLTYLNLGLTGAPDKNTYLTWRVNLSNGTAAFIDANSGKRLFVLTNSTEWKLDLETGSGDGPSTNCGHWFWTTNDDFWCNAKGCTSDADGEGWFAWAHIGQIVGWWYWNLGFNSYDNDNAEIEMYIHVGYWDGLAHWSGSCDFFEYSEDTPLAVDIIGHEYTHAVIEHLANFSYAYETGALEESFADTMGNLAEGYDNWGVGEHYPNGPLRIMGVSQPLTMSNYFATAADNGGVHTNCNIHNNVTYHIIKGGQFNGYDMGAGLGPEKSRWLFFSMLNYLGSNATFLDARSAAIQIAQNAIGVAPVNITPQDVCTIRNAYASAGLGKGDFECDGIEDDLGPDSDYDTIPDSTDNCIADKNSGQADNDADGLGDACDPNDDDDGWWDQYFGTYCSGGATANCDDNCRYIVQSDQADWNDNTMGDVCEDSDGDKYMDASDNCRAEYNPDQTNLDGDVMGDACDLDDDGDGIDDAVDNCPASKNFGQTDTDGDDIGDACDKCPNLASSDNGDPDLDGLGNACDPDDDNDTVLDNGDNSLVQGDHPCTSVVKINCDDNCREVSNLGQFDFDGDGLGSACDSGDHPDFGWDDETFSFTWTPGEAIVIPTPGPGDCMACGNDKYLPRGFLEEITINSKVDVFAQVVDSNGVAIVSGLRRGDLKKQTLRFAPLPATFIGGIWLASTAAPMLPQAVGPTYSLQYYLYLYPVETTPLDQTVTITLQITGDVPKVYLPLIGN